MNPARIIRSVALCLAAAFAILPIAAHPAGAQTLTWDGNTSSNWSNDSADVNWSGSAWSAGATARFAANVDGGVDYTVTLTDDIEASNLRLYNLVGTDPNNDVKVTLQGSQSLTINATGNLSLGPEAPTSPTGETVLDMGGLGTFNFNGASHIFRVGLHPGSGATHTSTTTVSTVTLADTNTITANALYMGDQNASGGGGRSYLYLGRQNTINANTISIGALVNHVRSTAYFQFADGLDDPSATFRGTNGTSAVPNWNIGRVATNSTTTWNTVVDLSAGTIDALVTSMLLGDANVAGNTGRAGTVNATFTMGDGTMEVATLGIGRVTGSGSLSNVYQGNGTFSILGADADFTAGTINIATMNHTATGGTPSTTGLFHLADGTATVNGGVVLGSNTKAADANSAGVTATVRQSGGTLTISGGLLEGSNVGGEVSSNVELPGGTATINGGLSADMVLVGQEGRTATATVESGAVRIGDGSGMGLLIGHRLSSALSATTTGSLDLSATDSVTIDTGTLAVAYTAAASSAANVSGTLTLSTTGANLITADLVRLGHIDLGATGTVTGTLNLGTSNTIHADTLIVGGDKSIGIVTIAEGGTLILRGKGGQETDPADLFIGVNNNPTTGANPTESHFNLAGGTLNATLDSLIIGQYAENPGAGGSGKGRFTMSDGTVTANSVVLADSVGSSPKNTTGSLIINGGSFTVANDITTGSGTSAISLAGGTLEVSGDIVNGLGDSTLSVTGTPSLAVGGTLAVDTLHVAYNAANGSLVFAAATSPGEIVIGASESDRGSIIVGYTEGHDLNSEGTLNFGNVTNLTAYLDDFMIGWRRTSSNGGGTAKGTVTLAENNYIDAATIVVSQNEYWNTDPESVLTLGADNTLKVDTFTVAGWRANGRVDLPAGGLLNLTGSSGAATDLLIADNNIGTSHDGVGTMDLSAGTFNATLNNLVIGYHLSGGGSGTGTLDFAAGAVTANSVVLGDAGSGSGTGIGTLDMAGGSFTVSGPVTLGTGSATSEGTINLSGGTLRAGTISKGAGQAVFNWTGGRLSVDSFGFDLLQTSSDGPSTLAPGNSIGTTTVSGNYTMDVGTLEIEIAAPGDHDFVMVHGNATLAGSLNVLLLDEYVPALGTQFDVLQTTGNLDISGLALTGDLPSTTFGWWDMDTVASGDGFLLRLSAVPEPSAAVLLILGVAVLLGWRRRK
ncbi:MAG: PEP-CTERM sorting domain-containing protein [Thermoguttaceae bacterium]|jgi:hypothetical protein|nr:PEP-CTERM sorting domain-containing protein [Thermoguttaceae bacterium]